MNCCCDFFYDKLKDKNINRIVPDNYRDIRSQFEINDDPFENEEYD